MEECEILAQKLKAIRKELGESQIVFAYNCGVSSDTLSLIEREKADPRLSTIQKIAAYTAMTVSELLYIV